MCQGQVPDDMNAVSRHGHSESLGAHSAPVAKRSGWRPRRMKFRGRPLERLAIRDLGRAFRAGRLPFRSARGGIRSGAVGVRPFASPRLPPARGAGADAGRAGPLASGAGSTRYRLGSNRFRFQAPTSARGPAGKDFAPAAHRFGAGGSRSARRGWCPSCLVLRQTKGSASTRRPILWSSTARRALATSSTMRSGAPASTVSTNPESAQSASSRPSSQAAA